MSRGRKCTSRARPYSTIARPVIKVMMLDQRNGLISSGRENMVRVSMGITMLIESVSKNMPLMKVMIRNVGQAI
jgi:hypothetical protein